ncbi:hypothetical protein NTGHW29_920039 [Candidatus Nitrotoga sp. HW29]|nr:hypothetical protein NTGHW29_920039 [Candidatus Nitrotoga sp. HW29]
MWEAVASELNPPNNKICYMRVNARTSLYKKVTIRLAVTSARIFITDGQLFLSGLPAILMMSA